MILSGSLTDNLDDLKPEPYYLMLYDFDTEKFDKKKLQI